MSPSFAEVFGRPCEGRWSAPGRVNLIGEYTDLNESFVLPLAIGQRTTVEAASRPDRVLGLKSLQQDGEAVEVDLDAPGVPGGWSAYPVAVARSLEASGFAVGGADLVCDSQVPIGAGLSSSAALECAVALALTGLAGVKTDAMELARIAQRAENEFVGVPCGIMDQAASMCCEEGHALLLDTRSLERRQVPLDLAAAGLVLLVVDTRVKHDLGESAYGDRRRSCEAAARALGVRALRDVPPDGVQAALAELGDEELVRRARHVLTEQARVLEVVRLLDSGRIADIGPILVAGHRSLRDDFEVSCVELDTVVEVALATGALGARMTGGGFGGSVVVLAEVGAASDVVSATESAFADKGFSPPVAFSTVPGPGARAER
ncbi:MAG: galactokinase [Acidimicrobiaceae bacterium]|nr:galactokinase [Acidimicrobiaceae bacterium]